MGQIKKEERYRRSLTEEDLTEEDANSRSLIERYSAMAEGPARDAAIEAEQRWREDLGLERI